MHSGQDNRQQSAFNNEDQDGTGEETFSRTRSGGGVLPKSSGRRAHIDGYNALDEMEDESDATSSGNEWDGGNDDDDVHDNLGDDDDDEEMSDDEIEANETVEGGKQSLLVSFRYQKGKKSTTPGLTVDSQTTNGASPAGSTIVLNDAGQIPDAQLGDDPANEKKALLTKPDGLGCRDLSNHEMKQPVQVYSPTMQVDPDPIT